MSWPEKYKYSITTSGNEGVHSLLIDYNQNTNSKRICPDDYFISLAVLASKECTGDKNKLGACIVDQEGKFVSLGFNTLLTNHLMIEKDYRLNIFGERLIEKQNTNDILTCDAVMNAIVNARKRNIDYCKNCTIYVNQFPSSKCSKFIIQSGIKKLIYLEDISDGQADNISSKLMLELAGVEISKSFAHTAKIFVEKPEHKLTCNPKEYFNIIRNKSKLEPSIFQIAMTDLKNDIIKKLFEYFKDDDDSEKISIFLKHLETDLIVAKANQDSFFMKVAMLTKENSPDPDFQVGACIVKENEIVSVGFNSHPNGTSNKILSWRKAQDPNNDINSKSLYDCHAELNAVFNSKCDLKGSSIYVTLFPCQECAKLIVQSGMSKVVYYEDCKSNLVSFKISKIILATSNIDIVHFDNENIVPFDIELLDSGM